MALAGFASLFVVALFCARNQKPDHAQFSSNAHEQYRGVTYWDCTNSPEEPHAWVKAELVLMGATAIGTAIHEISHKNVALSFGSCAEYTEWRRNAGSGPAMEAMAYCRQARLMYLMGYFESLSAAIEYYGENLSSGYEYGLTDAEGAELITTACDQMDERNG